MADSYNSKRGKIKNFKAHLAKDNNGEDIEFAPTFAFVKAVLEIDDDKQKLQDLFKGIWMPLTNQFELLIRQKIS